MFTERVTHFDLEVPARIPAGSQNRQQLTAACLTFVYYLLHTSACVLSSNYKQII